ncbi:MAG: hypothetical protein MUP58_02660 [Candidatus Nanohaloarchaeota archaeon QJJ-9]|nr:hypothetical protein [Candidatus Nanohaloarchaeota archaeon QJJ-9]
MNLKAEEEGNATVLKTEEDKHTVMNLVEDYLWKVGADAGYDKGHPYVGESKLIINHENPAEAIGNAVEKAKEDLEELKDQIK